MKVKEKSSEFTKIKDFTFYIASWNMAGVRPKEEFDLKPWLSNDQPYFYLF